jgi:hypothetical protein
MANIIVPKNPNADKDPFAQSDRDPIGRNAGKGDRNRSRYDVVRENLKDVSGMGKQIPGMKQVGPNRFRKSY